MPGRLDLEFFGWRGFGDVDLAFEGDSVLCSTDVFEAVFLSCFGGGSFSEVTATFEFLSMNA